MSEMIDLATVEAGIKETAQKAYRRIMDLPPEVRQDEKPRTGISVDVSYPGTRNAILFQVDNPSVMAIRFSVEKTVRAFLHGDVSSGNRACPEKMQFPGSVAINGLYVSVCNLKGEEDVAVAVLILAFIFKLSPAKVCRQIMKYEGELPPEFRNKNHYLYPIVWSEPEEDQSPDWDKYYSLVKKGSVAFKYSESRKSWPQIYIGRWYDIITIYGKIIEARVDGSREFSSEGLEWRKKTGGNIEGYFVVAWKRKTN